MKNETTGRAVSRFGIVNDAPSLKILPNPVKMIQTQHDQLNSLLSEYRDRYAVIHNDPRSTPIGKMPEFDDLRADMNRRIKNMRANSAFIVTGLQEAEAALLPDIKTSDDPILDEMRNSETRAVIRSLDAAAQVQAVVTGTPELINAIMESPVKFPHLSEEFLLDCLNRIDMEQNKEIREKIIDLESISATVELNFQQAARFITNAPAF